MIWTDEMDDCLKRCVGRGLTASATAGVLYDELGARVSRNAVIGRTHRLDRNTGVLILRGKGGGGRAHRNGMPAGPRPVTPSRVERRDRVVVKRAVKPLRPPPPVADETHQRLWVATEFREVPLPGDPCRFPITDVKAVGILNHKCCGTPTAEPGVPYCPWHKRVAWEPPQPRRPSGAALRSPQPFAA